MNKPIKYIIGIDEAGRGALAGPVAVGVVMLAAGEYRILLREELFPPGRDSKKLSPKQRNFYFARIKILKKAGRLNFAVSFGSHQLIDRRGIVYTVHEGIRQGLVTLGCSSKMASVRLDGGLKAPAEYADQQTAVKGDEKELIIALASIVAKVSRDRLMTRLAKRHPAYGFDRHKGYGTKAHYRALKNYGLSPKHRRSFLKRFTNENKVVK